MRPAFVPLVLSVALVACGGGSSPAPKAAATTEAKPRCVATAGEPEHLASAPDGTPSRVRLGPGMTLERSPATIAAGRGGRHLVVTGVVSGPDCAPLAGATLNAWQTNAAGKYGPGRGGDHCCYLQGTVRTDARGRYTLDTVMPRGYNGGPAHIHIEADHANAAGLLAELVFDDGGAPARRDDGRLRAVFDIVLPPG